MGKKGGKKLQTFCVNRISPLVKVPIQNKLGSNSPICANKKEQEHTNNNHDHFEENDEKMEENSEKMKNGINEGRKIMVVVDSSAEAKVALQWALTHTVQSQDLIILLYVAKLTTKQGLYFYSFLFLGLFLYFITY